VLADPRRVAVRSQSPHGWELYGPDDWTQANNLAADNPEQLAHLQQKFLLEAAKYKVFPLDDLHDLVSVSISADGGSNGSTQTWPDAPPSSEVTARCCLAAWAG